MVVSIDYVRVTGSLSVLSAVLACLDLVYGTDREQKPGRFFFAHSWRYAAGAELHFDALDADDGRVCVELDGEACAVMSRDERAALLHDLLELGLSATRLDVAIDVQGGMSYQLIDNVLDSCGRGELCRAKRFGVEQWSQSRGDVTGRMAKLGARGKLGSGRYVRVYDKGLESETTTIGAWVRWETEFSGDHAAEAARRVCVADDWEEESWSIALGAVDFRINNGRPELSRRPRVQWFEDLCSTIRPRCVKVQRDKTTLDSFAKWFRRCVVPTLQQMQQHGDAELLEVWHDLQERGGVNANISDAMRPVVWQWLREREQPQERGRDVGEACAIAVGAGVQDVLFNTAAEDA